jgi:hypothetical protein
LIENIFFLEHGGELLIIILRERERERELLIIIEREREREREKGRGRGSLQTLKPHTQLRTKALVTEN